MMAIEAFGVVVPIFILVLYYGFLRKKIYPEDYE